MKLRMMWNILIGRPVMYKMDIELDRAYNKDTRKYTNIMRVFSKKKMYIVDNRFRNPNR